MLIEFQYPVFDPPLGGVENYILETGKALLDLGHTCQVFCGPARKPTDSDVPFPVFRHPAIQPTGIGKLWLPFAVLNGTTNHMKSERPQPDVIVARYPAYSLAASQVFPDTDTRVIFLPAEDTRSRFLRENKTLPVKNRLLNHLFMPQAVYIEKKAAQQADALMVLYNGMKDLFYRSSGREATVNPRGVNHVRFHPNDAMRIDIRNELAISQDAPLIISVSRLSPEKNIQFGLECFAKIRNDAFYVVAGDGPERSHLEQLTDTLGVAKRVRFLGTVPEPETIYAAGDLFLHTAPDPFGHVLYEAMAAGLPALATGSPNVYGGATYTDTLPEQGCVGIDLHNAEQSAYLVDELLRDNPKRKQMGVDARAYVKRNMSWLEHAKRILFTV